jgi:hypothetical protein
MVIAYIIALQFAADPLDQAKAAYEQCVTAEAVHLGADNQESADTILRAVRFKCEPEWQQLAATFPSGTGVFIAEQARSRALAKWHSDAEGAAVAALLSVRLQRQGRR